MLVHQIETSPETSDITSQVRNLFLSLICFVFMHLETLNELEYLLTNLITPGGGDLERTRVYPYVIPWDSSSDPSCDPEV